MIMLGFAERAQAKQSKKKAIRQRGRRDASAIRRKPNRRLLSSKQPMGREGRFSIYPRVCVIYIFGRVVGRVPGVWLGGKNHRFPLQSPESGF